jgi:hypothetical protein
LELRFIYGTGGQIEKVLRDLEMWENHATYNLEKSFIPRIRILSTGDGEIDERQKIQDPFLFLI